MTCRHCHESIWPKDYGGYYHVHSWVEITADHDAEPAQAPAPTSR